MISLKNCENIGSCTRFEFYNTLNPTKEELKKKVQYIIGSDRYNYKKDKCVIQTQAISDREFWYLYFGKPVFRYMGCGGEVNIYIIKLKTLANKLNIDFNKTLY